MSVCNVLKMCAGLQCVSLAMFGLCVTVTMCTVAVGTESLVTLSRFLMFHYCGLPVAECIINFALWFADSLSSITNPLARRYKPCPGGAFTGSRNL